MQIWAYCQVNAYNLEKLKGILEKNDHRCEFFDEVLHAVTPEQESFFVFPYGVMVFWNIDKEQHYQYLHLAKPSIIGLITFSEEDEFNFNYGKEDQISRQTIILQEGKPLTKLAASHAIAQSAKLGIFEQTIEKTIEDTKHIPYALAKKGKQPLSRKELRKRIGQLHLDRSSINLHFDLLDEPDFFWDNEDLEPLYSKTCRYLDINDRVDVINKKMEVVSDLYQILGEELNNNHFARLEWTIIILIAIEIGITLLDKL